MKLHRSLIDWFSRLVPRRLRTEWRREWDAELLYHERIHANNLTRRSLGAFWDALALQPQRLEDEMFQDIRFAWRMLHKTRGVTSVAILSLALGIGANTAIFSVVQALVFSPLPYPDSNRLMSVIFDNGKPQGVSIWNYPKFVAFRARQTTLSEVATYSADRSTVTVNDQAQKKEVEIVDSAYLPMLGVKASMGRVFLPEEDRTPGAAPVALISDKFWREAFGTDPGVLGKTIAVQSYPLTIVGILPPEFRGQSGTTDVWAPLMMAEKIGSSGELTSGGYWWLKVIGRIRPGIGLEKARAEFQVLSPGVAKADSSMMKDMLTASGELRIGCIPLKDTKVDPEVRRSFLILLGVVGFVLLIASANTANLLLMRTVSREREFAIRLAIGGGRSRIVRQVLIESVMLSLMGAALGLVFARLGISWLTTAKPWNTIGYWSLYAKTFDYFAIGLDWKALLFTGALAGSTGILFGLAPARQASRSQITNTLKDGAGSSSAGFRSLRKPNVRSFLIVTEVALSVLLLVGAGLFVRTFRELTTVKLGFEPQNLMTLTMEAGPQGRPEAVFRRIADRLTAIPGVESASLSMDSPFSESGLSGAIQVESKDLSQSDRVMTSHNVATPGYFQTYRIATREGRVFDEHDRVGASRVVVVSREFAEQAWPGEEALGKRVKPGFRARPDVAGDWAEVIGVVDNVRYRSIEQPIQPAIYYPAWQPFETAERMALAPETISIRTSQDKGLIAAIVTREVKAVGDNGSIVGLSTMDDRIAQVTSRFRYSAQLMSLFAGLGLLLAAIGIYGVMTHAVSQRTREIGIRVALGARRRDLYRMIFAEAAVLILSGLIVGFALAIVSTRALTSQLYGVRPNDPITLAVTSVVLILAAIIACYLPARRAARLDATVALRQD